MKTTRRIATACCVALLAMAGCRQADRAISTPPALAELPHLVVHEPVFPINVAVEGTHLEPQGIFVPKFEPIKLTPEERKILGREEPPLPDELAFYRPPRGPEHGVSSESVYARYGIGRVGGALIGIGLPTTGAGVSGIAGRDAYGIGAARRGEQVGLARERAAEVGGTWTAEVGECLRREGARAAPRRDY